MKNLLWQGISQLQRTTFRGVLAYGDTWHAACCRTGEIRPWAVYLSHICMSARQLSHHSRQPLAAMLPSVLLKSKVSFTKHAASTTPTGGYGFSGGGECTTTEMVPLRYGKAMPGKVLFGVIAKPISWPVALEGHRLAILLLHALILSLCSGCEAHPNCQGAV